nr:crosslink repair DNA glycosylase YcaQ family protein [Rhodococcus aetherivorans]
MTPRTLTARALGRATLARQHLLRRGDLPAIELVEHLLGLQAQAPSPPYFALWARLRRFRPTALADLLESRDVVRIVLMRGTVFAVSAADAVALRDWIQPLLDRDLTTNTQYAAGLAGLDLRELAAVGRDLLRDGPRSLQELRPLLAERFPGRDPAALAYGLRNLLPLVQVPPRGLWGALRAAETHAARRVDRSRPGTGGPGRRPPAIPRRVRAGERARRADLVGADTAR